MQNALLVFVIIFIATSAAARDFYIDPENGSDDNSGSMESPWRSLQHLFDQDRIESRKWNSLPYDHSSFLVVKNNGAPVKAGDRIFLHSGYYGELEIISYYNTTPITILAADGAKPVFRNILVRSSSMWNLQGLYVDAGAYPQASFSTLISLDSHSWTGPVHTISVNGCSVSSTMDSSGWSLADWNSSKVKNGIGVDGRGMSVGYNTLLNVNFGISVGASHSHIHHNTIKNFAGDGLRGLGNYTIFEYNTVKNSYDVNSNHDDGFQSWSVGADGSVGAGSVVGIVLRRNSIINYEDPAQPFRGTLQGIGCFDGMFENWIVEGNRIEVDHWHGISFYGAINTVIRDNVVTDPNDSRPGPAWIYLTAHKNGTPSHNNEVTCNVAPKILASSDSDNIVRYNTLSNTGGPRHRQCPPLANISTVLPLLLIND